MAMTYSGKVTTPLACKVGTWTTIVTSEIPTGTLTDALLYVNVTGTLAAGKEFGSFDLRAVRGGTTDDTAVDTRSIAAPAGGAFTCFCTHTWFGARPGDSFLWQIRPRVNIASLTVNTRYAKAKPG